MISKMAPANIKLNPIGVAVFLATALCLMLYAFGVPEWFSNEPKVSMKELLAVSIQLSERAGVKVRTIREDGFLQEKEKGKTKEGASDMLTRGDTESHRTIVYGMSKAFPQLQIISEETDLKPVNFQIIKDVSKSLSEVDSIIKKDEKVSMKDITVWVDPLDATKEYTENLKQYVTVMVCVAVKGIPHVGVIHKPFLKETYWAWVNYGHSKNLKIAQKSTLDTIPQYKFIVSRSHAGSVESVAKEAYGNLSTVVPAGGAGYKTLEVINGNADAYLHVTLIKKWDICAGNAVLNALQGKLTTLGGDLVDYSAKGDVKNKDGLLATVYGHYGFLEKLSKVAEAVKSEGKTTKS